MANKIKAPWEQAEANEPKMLLCHFSDEELHGMDILQGEVIEDNDGIRSYPKLAEIAEIPEIKQMFEAAAVELHANEDLPKGVYQEGEELYRNAPPYQESTQEKENPYLRHIESMGTEGDSKLAWVPENFVELLIDLRGDVKKNPHTGLLMFGKRKRRRWKKWFRTLMSIGGGIVGNIFMPGVTGAMLGAGLGRFGSGLLTGQKAGPAAMAGLKHAGKAALVSTAGGMLNSVAPGIGETLGSILPKGVSTSAANFFTGPDSAMGIWDSLRNKGATEAAAKGAEKLPSLAASEVGKEGAKAAAQKITEEGAKKVAETGWQKAIAMGKDILPYITIAAGHMQDKKEHKKAKKDYEEREREKSDFMKSINYPWRQPSPHDVRANPDFYDLPEDFVQSGVTVPPFLGYKKGGRVDGVSEKILYRPTQPPSRLIKGPGKGQDDKIRTRIRPNTYIVDASTTSMLGDGSTEAGGKVLKYFEEQVTKKHKHITPKQEDYPLADVFLSDGEYALSDHTLTRLGNGNNNKGAKIIKEAIKRIREHKSSNGSGLPPKAKSMWTYIEGR